MTKILKLGLSALALSILAGCASAPSNHSPYSNSSVPSSSAYGNESSAAGSKAHGLSFGQGFKGQNLNTIEAKKWGVPTNLQVTTVLFGFNRYNLTQDAQNQLQPILAYLLKQAKVPVVIQGYTDQSGSANYNFHLGQRRANAVKQYFASMGINANRLATLSYGETRPAALPSQFLNANDTQGMNTAQLQQAELKATQHAYKLNRRAIINVGAVVGNPNHA